MAPDSQTNEVQDEYDRRHLNNLHNDPKNIRHEYFALSELSLQMPFPPPHFFKKGQRKLKPLNPKPLNPQPLKPLKPPKTLKETLRDPLKEPLKEP